jgi:hypothetical protein
MDINELIQHLELAREQLQDQLRSFGSHNMREVHKASQKVEEAERALAAARGEEYAQPYDIGFVPEAAVTLPIVLQTDYYTFLAFSAMYEKPDGMREEAGYGIVQFDGCSLTKFGYPNDEALMGHPLMSRGLGAYGVYEVRNSTWIKQVTEFNRITFPNTPPSTKKHFMFSFHDSTFECIARGLHAWVSTELYTKVVAELAQRILEPIPE